MKISDFEKALKKVQIEGNEAFEARREADFVYSIFETELLCRKCVKDVKVFFEESLSKVDTMTSEFLEKFLGLAFGHIIKSDEKTEDSIAVGAKKMNKSDANGLNSDDKEVILTLICNDNNKVEIKEAVLRKFETLWQLHMVDQTKTELEVNKVDLKCMSFLMNCCELFLNSDFKIARSLPPLEEFKQVC